MGMPNMNFPIKRLSKMMFINLVQEHKTREEENYFIKYKDKYINESLLDFSKKEKNSFLSELIHNLLNFRKKCLKQKKLDNKERINIAANYLLFHKIEKCLIEISYMSNKQHRDNKIELLYNWYKNILNKNKTLKIIKSKLFKYDNEKINLNDENKTTSNKNLETKGEIINTIIKNKEETNIDKNKETIKEKPQLDKKDNKKIIIPTKPEIKKNINIPKNISSESSCKKHHLFLSSTTPQKSDISLNKKNFSKNFITPLALKKNCASIKNIPRSNSELVLSSFYTQKNEKKNIFPEIKNNITINKVEKNIIDSKFKSLGEKRNMEEINESLKVFGISRAKFKENLNNKYEMKELINMYVNENKNNIDIKKSKLLKKYIKIKHQKKNFKKFLTDSQDENKEAKNIDNIKLNSEICDNGKKGRIFYGIEHKKIIVNKIKNINYNTNIIQDEKMKIITYNIKMKVSRINLKLNNENIMKKNNSFDNIIKNQDLYKTDLNNSINNNNYSISIDHNENTKDKYYSENNRYNEEEEIPNTHFNFSLYNTNNLKKINHYKKICLSKIKFKPMNLSEKKKLDMYNNYIKNKFDFLSIRKNMEYINKNELKQISTKYENKFLNKIFLNDNNDDDENKNDIIRSRENNANLVNKKFRLSKVIFEPLDKNFYSLYYFPKPGSKLLVRK